MGIAKVQGTFIFKIIHVMSGEDTRQEGGDLQNPILMAG